METQELKFKTTLQSAGIKTSPNNNNETSIYIPKNIAQALSFQKNAPLALIIEKENILTALKKAQIFLETSIVKGFYSDLSNIIKKAETVFAGTSSIEYQVTVVNNPANNQDRWYFKDLKKNAFNIRDFLIENQSFLLFFVENDKIVLHILNDDIDNNSFDEKAFIESNKKLESLNETDKETIVYRRIEQSYLRKFLFQFKSVAQCSICNRDFPKDFLVTAHLKMRSKCTFEERIDYKVIVKAMCNFGCDELYERGYISVLNGKIVKLNKNKPVTNAITQYIDSLEGQPFKGFNDLNKKYLDWHYNYHQ